MGSCSYCFEQPTHFKMNFAMKAVVMLAVLALVSAEEKTAEEQTLVAVADQDSAASHYYGAWRGYGHGWGYGHGYFNPTGYYSAHSGSQYRHRRSADDSADLSTDASHYGRYGGYGGHYGRYYGGHYGGHRGYGYGGHGYGYRHYY